MLNAKSPRRLMFGVVITLSLAVAGVTTGSAQEPDAATHSTDTATTTGTPLADAAIIDSTASGGQTVVLTFDDGPNPPDTTDLLAVLAEHQITAVFCLWGDHVQQNPGVVRQIVSAGHTLCNHSMHHDDMGSWSTDQIRADLQQTSAAIQAAAPGAEIPYFRAPNGSWGQTPQVAAELGMQPLGWRVQINDWEPATADQLAQRLRDGIAAAPGAVVLAHDGGGDRAATVQAVDTVIPELRQQGWTFELPAPPR